MKINQNIYFSSSDVILQGKRIYNYLKDQVETFILRQVGKIEKLR
jgi:hypothetical protein